MIGAKYNSKVVGTSFKDASENTLQEFCRRFNQQSGTIYFARSPEEVVSTINQVIKSKTAVGESCCAANLSLMMKKNGSTVDLAPQIHGSIQFSEFERNPRQVARSLDVGITKSYFGIAETGTIVDVSYTDQHRLLSSVSRIHVALVESAGIKATLQDIAPQIAKLLMTSGPKPVITFIGGPSRTSDIEMKSVLGVHGPHEVHAVIYCE